MTTNLSHDTDHAVIEDVQASADARRITIDKVGVKGIRHPVRLQGRDGMIQSTVANLAMYVRLPHDVKGTHMSRFLEILNAHHDAFTTESFEKVLAATAERLEATEAHIEMTFPYFIEKAAPVSGVTSLLDYEVTLIGEVRNGVAKVTSKVLVPVTSLCPCPKAISDYGARNHRLHATLSVRASTPTSSEVPAGPTSVVQGRADNGQTDSGGVDGTGNWG